MVWHNPMFTCLTIVMLGRSLGARLFRRGMAGLLSLFVPYGGSQNAPPTLPRQDL
jgi:hypothetical protein